MNTIYSFSGVHLNIGLLMIIPERAYIRKKKSAKSANRTGSGTPETILKSI